MPTTASTSREPDSAREIVAVASVDPVQTKRSQPVVDSRYERIDMDRYAVIDGTVVGFVDVVSPVFVCYLGGVFAKAVEIAQVHDFHAAVDVVLAAVSTKAERSA